MQKKILYVITKSNYGGAGHYVFDLATAAAKEGFDVLVACGGNGLLVEKLNAQRIRTVTIPNLQRDVSIFKELKVLSTLRTLFRAEKPDIVHLNSSKIGGIGAIAGRMEHVSTIIYTAHGWAFNERRGYIWRSVMYVASIATAWLCHVVITISHAEEKQALSFPLLGKKKVRMIYIGSGEPIFEDRDEARSYLESQFKGAIPNDVPVIGTIGELHKNKGYVYALEMCEILKKDGVNFLYLIIGEGEERQNIEMQIKEKKLENTVVLLGEILTPVLGSTLLKAFDIFLLPSTKEGLPYVLLEAGYAELPVVATCVGGIPEIIVDGDTGLLTLPASPEQMALNIKKLLDDGQMQTSMGFSLKKKVHTTFSLLAMLKDTLFEYRK